MSSENHIIHKFSRCFQGQCLCGQPLTVSVLTHIRCESSSYPADLIENLATLNPYQCVHCGEAGYAVEALSIDHVAKEQLILLLPSALRHRSVRMIAEQISHLSDREDVSFAGYFHSPQLRFSASPSPQITVSSVPQHTEERGLGAPEIASLPEHLNPVEEHNPALELEMTHSPTQVSVIKHAEPSSLKSFTQEREVSVLDSLIDSALNDEVSETTITPSPASEKKKASRRSSSEFHRESTAIVSVSPAAHHSTESSSTGAQAASSKEEQKPAEPTRLLYAQTTRGFDDQHAKGASRYITIGEDGVVELSAKVDERHAERWITDELDVRVQLHVIEMRGSPCLTLYTLVDGSPQDELCWPIKVDESLGPKILRSLRSQFRVELTLFKKNGNFYGQRIIEAPLEENAAYLINRVKQMKMTHSVASAIREEVNAEGFDREGQMKHPFTQASFSEISSAKEALLAVGIWAYWSTVKQRDYLIFVKSFPIPWLRRLQHRVLKAAMEFGIHMPANLQSQAVVLGLTKSDVELLQKTIAHFVEVNIQLRTSELTPIEIWENWDALLTQLDQLGIDADEEVEQLAFEAMQRVGLDQEFEDDEDEFSEVSLTTSQTGDSLSSVDLAFDDSVDDLSDISEIKDFDPPTETPPLPEDLDEVELISEEFIEEEYLTDAGDAFLLIDDLDIIEEDIVDPVTAGIGQTVLKNSEMMKTQMYVSIQPDGVSQASDPIQDN